jgi:hypothetical protein
LAGRVARRLLKASDVKRRDTAAEPLYAPLFLNKNTPDDHV